MMETDKRIDGVNGGNKETGQSVYLCTFVFVLIRTSLLYLLKYCCFTCVKKLLSIVGIGGLFL